MAPVQVLSDPPIDNPVLAEATPPFGDLRAGYIGETDTTIDFTWEVEDIPDPLTTGFSGAATYYWEFTLDDPGDNPPVPFSLRVGGGQFIARASVQVLDQGRTVTVGGGSLAGNCVTENNITSCTTVEGSSVSVKVDPVNDRVTASVRRKDMRGADGNSIAVDGATLDEVVLFRGIGALPCVALCVSTFMDEGDMDAPYVLGSPRE